MTRLLAHVDVAVIGAGAVGAATARLLSHHRLRVALVEATGDVGGSLTALPSAVLRTGFDAAPGTLAHRFVPRGHALLAAHAPCVGIAVERTGAVVVADDDHHRPALDDLAAAARAAGRSGARVLTPQEAAEIEPGLGPGVVAAVLVPDEAVIDPWSTPLAFAVDAVANDTLLLRHTPVTAVRIGAGIQPHVLTTPAGAIAARFVVDTTRSGPTAPAERTPTPPCPPALAVVLDRLARPAVRHLLVPVPVEGRSVVPVLPTVFGTVVAGPAAGTVADVLAGAHRLLPALADEEVIAIRRLELPDPGAPELWVDADPQARLVRVGGRGSTGLTAAMALAEHTLDLLADAGLPLEPKPDPVRIRVPDLGEANGRPHLLGGRIVCPCELVTEGELTDALAGAVPPLDLDALTRRTRAGLGRCHGAICHPAMLRALEAATDRHAPAPPASGRRGSEPVRAPDIPFPEAPAWPLEPPLVSST